MPSDPSSIGAPYLSDSGADWVASGVQQLLLQRHAALLRSRDWDTIANRILLIILLGALWLTPLPDKFEASRFCFFVGILAISLLFLWGERERRASREIGALERALSGERVTYNAGLGAKWEDVYSSFRAELNRMIEKDFLFRFFQQIEKLVFLMLTLASILIRTHLFR